MSAANSPVRPVQLGRTWCRLSTAGDLEEPRPNVLGGVGPVALRDGRDLGDDLVRTARVGAPVDGPKFGRHGGSRLDDGQTAQSDAALHAGLVAELPRHPGFAPPLATPDIVG